jgi:hypothetical protein
MACGEVFTKGRCLALAPHAAAHGLEHFHRVDAFTLPARPAAAAIHRLPMESPHQNKID